MPIQNTGSDIRLRGNAGDGVTDINEEINSADPYTGEVKLGEVNTAIFPNITDGDVITGRAMSEMQGESLFDSALPQTEADGALGESLLLEGNNYTFHRTPSLTSNRTTFTYSGWYKFNNLDSGNIIIMESGPTSGNSYISLRIDNANNNIYGLVGTGSGNPWLVRSPELFFDTSSWFHFVFAVDTTKDFINDRLRVYVNGIEIKFIYTANTIAKNQTFDINDGSSRICIGRTARTDQYAAYGQTVVADAKFIDGTQLRPDSFGELVQGIWIPKAFNTPSTDTLVTSNLIANYELNGDANDTSGSATTYNGTPSNVTFLNNNYGIGDFNGSNAFINLGSTIDDPLRTAGAFGVSMWFKTPSGSQVNAYGGKLISLLNNIYLFINIQTNNTLLARVGQSNGTQREFTTSALSASTWYHIAFTGNSSNGVTLYLNGSSQENLPWDGTFDTYTNTNYKFNYLGYQGAGVAYLTGQIGEVQIYNSVLTNTNVLQNYNATKHKYAYGLNGFHLPLNNTSTGTIVDDTSLKLHLDASDASSYTGSGTNWNDLTSNNNDGTISGANFLSSTNGGVFDFDGSNDKVTITTLGTFLASSDNKTYSAWFKSDGPSSGNREIFSSYGDGTNNWAIRLYMRPHQNNGDLLYGSKAGGNIVYGYSNTTNINNGEWYHACVVHNTALNTLTLYVNGKFDGTVNIGSGTASDDFYIGTYGTAYYWDGKIAQVRVYNKALTAQEVIQNYRATQNNYEQVSLVDISGNANSFTSTNIDYTDHVKDQPLDNYATLNPSAKPPTGTYEYQYGNLRTYSASNNVDFGTTGTIPVTSGKWYFECQFITNAGYSGTTGWLDSKDATVVHSSTYPVNSISNLQNNLQVKINSTTWVNVSNSFAANGVWSPKASVAFDADTGKLWVKKATDTTWYNSGDPAAGTNPVMTLSAADMYIMFACQGGSNRGVWWHVSEDNWDGTAPTGYKAVSTKNLPAPAFDPDGATPDKPSNYFKAVTYQGNGGTQGEAYGYKEGSRAAVFNGSSSKVVVSGFAQPTGDVSASMWIKFDSISSAQKEFFDWVGNSNVPTIRLNTYNSDDLRFSAGNGQRYISADSLTISTGVWYHLAISLDRSANAATCYFNGSPLGSTITISGSSVDTEGLFIGCNLGQNRFTDGQIDQVRIFDKALSSTEVGYLADDDTTNIDAISNLIAHYDMEGDANDTSGSATTYNGTASNVTYTQDKPYGNIDVGFKPDFVWIKDRFDGADHHALFDSVRGAPKRIFSSSTSSQSGTATTLTRFDSNGFTLSSSPAVNEASNDYIAWAWKAGGAAVSNTDGGVPSQVSANTEAGFSILTWTYSSGTATVGHGLDSAPELIIYKKTSGSQVWLVFTTVIDGTLDINYLNTESFANSSLSLPTDSVFSIDTGHTGDYVGYCFHSVDGFSKIGSYTGNASTTGGPFIYTGFKPAWIMIKQTSASGTRWIILDNARRTNNPATGWLSAEYTGSEQTDSSIALQFMSNGFKVGNPGTSNASINGSGQTYIYMAFAEDPVKYSNGVATLGDGNEFIQDANYPEDNFAATTYTGNGGTQKITTGVDADLVWIKNRDAAYSHMLYDSVRGAGNDLSTDTTGTGVVPGLLTSFDANGFTIIQGGSNRVNFSGDDYVAWAWKAAGHEYKSAAFNGSSSKIILPNSLSTAVGNNDFSVSFFVYVNDVSNDEVYVNLSNPYQFYVRKFASGNIYIELGGVNGFDTGVSLSTGWHHIAVTKSSTAGLVLYVDNTANTFSSKTANLGSSSVDTSLGGYNNGTLPLDGKLDQVRIFDKALSSSEVTTVYNETKNTVNTLQVLGDTSCIATYRLNGDALDLSGNYNGTESNIDYQTGSHFAYNIYENKARTFSHKTSTLGLDTGTITPTDINANRDNGFSIIKWTGNGISGSKIPHGLSKPPEIIITKGLTNPTSWVVGIGGISGFGVNDYLTITSATKNSSSTFYQAYEKDIFQVGVSSANEMNKNSSNEYISYAWRSVPGFSKIGKYTGDGGSSNNVYLGFEPKWVMIKLTSASGQHWYIMDSSRENLSVEKSLSANLNAIEESLSNHLDFTSTGFTLTKSSTAFNQNGYTYIYMAFAHR